MDEKLRETWNQLTSEQQEAVIQILASNTVRDVPKDNRVYYHVRLGQFETVVDGRDCNMVDMALEYATMNRTQAWYYDPRTNNDPPLVTTWKHSQYIDWLRR